MPSTPGLTRRVRDRWLHFTNGRYLPALALAVGAFALAVFSTARLRFPPPSVEDEFSYNLAAEMLTRGTVSQPAHPMASAMESPHVLVTPRYVSKYPPGKPLLMAASLRLFGTSRVAIWAMFALMAASLFWMLRAWMPPRWAFIAALWNTVFLGAGWWTHSAFGGAICAAGGALVLGAAARIVRDARPVHGVVLGLGLVVLATTRPFEGVLLALPVAAWLAAWLLGWRRRHPPQRRLAVVVGLAPVLAAGGAGLLTYNHAATGAALSPPYLLYERLHGEAPAFLWQEVPPLPADATPPKAAKYRRDVSQFRELHTPSGFVRRKFGQSRYALSRYVPLALAFPLLLVPILFLKRRLIVPAASITLVYLGMLGSAWFLPHYLAPLTGALLLFHTQGIRTLGASLRRWPLASRAVVSACVVGLLATSARAMADTAPRGPLGLAHWTRYRDRLQEDLVRRGGRHLIVVRYSPCYASEASWVANGASIDQQPVVWVTERGPAEMASVQEYFAGRSVWLLELAEGPGQRRFGPYPPTAGLHTAVAAVAPAPRPAGAPISRSP